MESFTFFTRITNVVLVAVISCIFLVVFLFSTEWFWPEMHGSSHIGNGLYLLERDGGPIIVKGTNIHGKTCYGGDYIIPTYDCSYDSTGKRNEYVLKEMHNDKWILVKDTILTLAGNKYYLIEKNFPSECSANIITKEFITSFPDSISFLEYVHSHNIDINWQ